MVGSLAHWNLFNFSFRITSPREYCCVRGNWIKKDILRINNLWLDLEPNNSMGKTRVNQIRINLWIVEIGVVKGINWSSVAVGSGIWWFV